MIITIRQGVVTIMQLVLPPTVEMEDFVDKLKHLIALLKHAFCKIAINCGWKCRAHCGEYPSFEASNHSNKVFVLYLAVCTKGSNFLFARK